MLAACNPLITRMDHSHHEMGSESHSNHDHTSFQHIDHMSSDLNHFNVSDDLSLAYPMETQGHEGHAGHNMHGGHGGHGVHEAHAGHEGMMSMVFHGGYNETILFSWWEVTDIGEFTGSFLAIFMMALLYEGLKYYRKHLLWKTYSGLQYCAVAPPDKGVANVCATDEPQVIQPTMLSKAHAWQTLLHGLQVLVSYMLMLVFMTYNVWLCAAVVLGSAAGYFLFGWRESVVVDFTEHCH
uniref:Copper transport protein n=3 Tax=Pectinophora gossypiella TaxID=13191 RepID=A0A1E1WL17_PECGO